MSQIVFDLDQTINPLSQRDPFGKRSILPFPISNSERHCHHVSPDRRSFKTGKTNWETVKNWKTVAARRGG